MNKMIFITLSMAVSCVKSLAEPAPEFHSLSADFRLSSQLAACYPQLAALQAYDELPFPQVSKELAQIIFKSERVTPVIFPFDSKMFAPNRYAIYSIHCGPEASDSCHYLSVMPTLGLPQYHLFGPLDLSCDATGGSQSHLE